jgi:hypothetical protein
VPTPCELKAALGVPTAGKQLEKMCLILRASQHAIALLRGGKIMKQLGLGIIVALGLTLPAFANPPQLQGTYAFTYNDFCLQSTSGFNANLTPLPGTVNASSAGTTGFEHFIADGTGTVTVTGDVSITLVSTPLSSSAGTATLSFDFTYKFNPDPAFSQ